MLLQGTLQPKERKVQAVILTRPLKTGRSYQWRAAFLFGKNLPDSLLIIKTDPEVFCLAFNGVLNSVFKVLGSGCIFCFFCTYRCYIFLPLNQ